MMDERISYKALKLRLYPTKEQHQYLMKCFGSARFIYNFYLAEKNDFYEKNLNAIPG